MTPERIPLLHGWSLWRRFVLRGAGFAATMLAPLAAHDSIAVADRLIAHEDAVLGAREDAIAVLERVIEPLRGDARKPVGRALKKLRSGQLPEPVAELGEGVDPIQILSRMKNALASARADAERVFAQDSTRISEYLRTVASDTRFLEACTWQNRAAVRTAIDRVREGRVSNPSQHRQHEQLVARYLQRYCAKNDTIGFFGPFGWGTIVDGSGRFAATPGPSLLSKRRVYFEHWVIDALAQRLCEDQELLLDVVPRQMPTIRLEGALVRHDDGRFELPSEFALVLGACDGSSTAREIFERISEGANPLSLDTGDVIEILLELRDRKLVCWTLQIPSSTAYPERELRRLLGAARGTSRDSALAALDELEGGKSAVVSATGSVDALGKALDELDAIFTHATGQDPTRRAGKMYAGRTIVYEDCQRDFDIRIGPELVGSLGPPLSLVLQSARWYTHRVGTGFRAAFDSIYDDLQEQTRTSIIDYARFFDRAAAILPMQSGDAGELVGGVLAELHRRWESILGNVEGKRRVEVTSNAITEEVVKAFDAPGPGWPTARFHSPDLMIAARSASDALAGRGMYVLGEIHTGRNMLATPLFLQECPFVEELVRAEREDVMVESRVRQVVPKGSCARQDFGPPVERDFDIESGVTSSHLPRSRVLAAADLVVERTPVGLCIRTRDGRTSFDVIVFFEMFLQAATWSRFAFVGPYKHTPRVVIDDLVVVRELWRFVPEEMPFVAARGLEQFVAARRWAKSHSIPRYVFVRVPEETKPIFVDFESPIYVEMLCKCVRGASKVTISEMMPALDELWLPDHEGRLYTAELRIIAVDPIPWKLPNSE